jgi:hypothetical protein
VKSKSYGRCTCGARVEMDPAAYGEGYCGRFRDACEPCADRAEEQYYRDQWKDFAYGPGPAVFDGDF